MGFSGGKVVLFSVFLSSLFYFFPSITILYYFGARRRENILKSRTTCKTVEIRLVIVAETTLIYSLFSTLFIQEALAAVTIILLQCYSRI